MFFKHIPVLLKKYFNVFLIYSNISQKYRGTGKNAFIPLASENNAQSSTIHVINATSSTLINQNKL